MTTLLLSCEHGGNGVPRTLRPRFARAEAVLESHRGWDPGALSLARLLAAELPAPLSWSTTSRLVVDLNRSLHHRHLLSEWTRGLSAPERAALLAEHYHPFRDAFAADVDEALASGPVLHLSIHSFVPVLNGRPRHVDLGLLYDPRVPAEVDLARAWVEALRGALPELRIRRNAPYRGRDDGHTSGLRRRFAGQPYLGIEIEVSQGLSCDPRTRREVARALMTSLRGVLAEGAGLARGGRAKTAQGAARAREEGPDAAAKRRPKRRPGRAAIGTSRA
ncbi:MAG: N-formylglutamate amidohydrolase [Polyangiaceae bacterium]